MTNILEVNNVTKIFKRRGGGQVIAVDNVTFTLREGQSTMVAVAGESGSGKSTLALLADGLARAHQRYRALSWCRSG